MPESLGGQCHPGPGLPSSAHALQRVGAHGGALDDHAPVELGGVQQVSSEGGRAITTTMFVF